MTGSVIKKPNGRYGARAWDAIANRRVWLGTFDTRREAKAAIVDYYAQPRLSLADLTCEGLAERWLTEGAVQKGWRLSTQMHNRERVKHFLSIHGNRKARHIRVSDALTWATGNPRELPALRAMFGFARLIEAVSNNPFAELGLKRPAKVRERIALTEEEVRDFAAKAGEMHGPWHESLIIFAAYTGLRAGELFALQYTDLGLDELTVSRALSSRTGEITAPKNGKPRTVILPPLARQAVTHLPRRPRQTLVFVNPRDAKQWTLFSYGYWWRQLRAAMGQPKLTFHELRHTAATILLERGVSAEDVAHQLGHADPSLIYSTYGHPSEAGTRARLKAAFGSHVSGTVTSLAPAKEEGA